jgi:ectoine hydroxylase-related dioxygenase (phytanoyl-CoA dioxygenase family)
MNNSAVIDGVEVKVVEITGASGDVFLTHPLLLHAAARNCASVPRLVFSRTAYRSAE